MNVVVTNVVAVKPKLLRVECYTTQDGKLGGDYELIVAESDFTTIVGENEVQIDLDKFKLLVSQGIMAANDTANLAAALVTADLEWEIDTTQVVTEEKETPKSVEGLSLAYGDNVNNESANT